MITVLHGGGSLGTPKSGYVIYMRPHIPEAPSGDLQLSALIIALENRALPTTSRWKVLIDHSLKKALIALKNNAFLTT